MLQILLAKSLRIFVRAGVEWSGVGTLAVALGCGCVRLTECLWGPLRSLWVGWWPSYGL